MDPISRTVLLGAANSGGESYWISTLTHTDSLYLYGISVDSNKNTYVSGEIRVGGYTNVYTASLDVTGASRWHRYVDEPGTISVSGGRNLGIDSSNNIYVIGQTYISPSMASLLVKYDSSGALQWQKYLNSSVSEMTYGLSIDSSNNVYVAGATDSTGTNRRGLAVKYDTSGAVQWQKQLSASSIYYGGASDSSGNSYYCGLGDNTLTRTLTVKYNSSGTQQWARRIYTAGGISANYIALDSSGNVYVLADEFSEDRVVLFKYNSAGSLQWQRQIGNIKTTSNEYCGGVYVTVNDEIYVCGYTTYQASNGYDLFVFKYDTAGVVQWKRQLGNSSVGLVAKNIVLAYNTLYITGYATTDLGLVTKLPSDGSLTGTYGNWQYKTSSLPETSSSYTDGSTTLTSSSSSLTAGTSTLSDATPSITVTTTTL